jgi:hypothetical protein
MCMYLGIYLFSPLFYKGFEVAWKTSKLQCVCVCVCAHACALVKRNLAWEHGKSLGIIKGECNAQIEGYTAYFYLV